MTRAWFGLADEGAPTPIASATAVPIAGGRPITLCAWDEPPSPDARAIAPAIIDPDGAAVRISLILVPADVVILFDDPAVAGARRAVLAGVPAPGLSTLVRGASWFAGAVTLLDPSGLDEDPFALVWPAIRLRVGAGLFGPTLPPAGPTIERYGSRNPWPLDRFT